MTNLRLVTDEPSSDPIVESKRLPIIAVLPRGGVLLIGKVPCGFFEGEIEGIETFARCSGFRGGMWQNVGSEDEPFHVGVDVGEPIAEPMPFVEELPVGFEVLASRALEAIRTLGYDLDDAYLTLDL